MVRAGVRVARDRMGSRGQPQPFGHIPTICPSEPEQRWLMRPGVAGANQTAVAVSAAAVLCVCVCVWALTFANVPTQPKRRVKCTATVKPGRWCPPWMLTHSDRIQRHPGSVHGIQGPNPVDPYWGRREGIRIISHPHCWNSGKHQH